MSSHILNPLEFSYVSTVILNNHTRLRFKFTINFFSNTFNILTLRYQQAASHRRIFHTKLCLTYIFHSFYINFLLVRVSPDRCAVEYLSDRKVIKVCPAVVTSIIYSNFFKFVHSLREQRNLVTLPGSLPTV